MKIYTVTKVADRPTIKLTGKWIEEKDFKIGDKIEAVIENGMILLMKTTKEEEKQIKQIIKK